MTTVMPARRLPRLVPVLLCLIGLNAGLAACGSGGTTTENAGDEESVTTVAVEEGDQGGGGGGAPLGPASGGAAASPVKIPPITLNGRPPSAVKEFLESQLEECGGSLCVKLAYVDQDHRPIRESDPRFGGEGPRDAERCGFSPERSGATRERQVERGSVVTLVFNCAKTNAGGDGDGGTEGPTTTRGDTDVEPPTGEGAS